MMNFPSRYLPIVLAATLLACSGSAHATGYRVSPMMYDLTPSGKDATTQLRVQNDSDKAITIELVAEKRSFNERGVESRTPADDDFVLFPPQAVVAAGATQVVRVQYIGKPDLTRSETYTVTVKQVPVALPAGGATGVQFMFNFSTLANIVPPKAQPALTVSGFSAVAAGGYQLRLRNDGAKYASIATARVTVASPTQSYTLTSEEWRKLLGTSWLLPGNERIFDLPATLPLPKGAEKASVELPASAL